MSQNLWSPSGDSQENSGRGLDEKQERKNYEGFEGMNYEQKRQPYNPKHTSTKRGNDNGGDGERRDEL